MQDREYNEIPSDAETDEEIAQQEQQQSAPINITQPLIASENIQRAMPLTTENRYTRENEKPVVRVLTTRNNQNSYILFDPKIHSADTPNELISVRQFNDNEKEVNSDQRAKILVLEKREDNDQGLYIFYDPKKHFGVASKFVTRFEFSENFNRFKKVKAVPVDRKWVNFDPSNDKHLQLTVTEIYNCQISQRVKFHQLAKSSLNKDTSKMPCEDERDQPSMSDETKKRSRDENSDKIGQPEKKRKNIIDLDTDNNPIEVVSTQTPLDIEISNLRQAIANKTQELHDLQNRSKSIEAKFNNIATTSDNDDNDESDLDDQALQNIMQDVDDYKSGAIENKIKVCQEELESLQKELASKIAMRSDQIHSPSFFNQPRIKQARTKQSKESPAEKDNPQIDKIKLAIDKLKKQKQDLELKLTVPLEETIQNSSELITKDYRSFSNAISALRQPIDPQRTQSIKEQIAQKEKEVQILANTLNKLESESKSHRMK